MTLLKYLLVPLRYPWWLLLWFVYRCLRKPCETMWVLDFAGNSKQGEFLDQAARALQFIRKHDPRRAERVEKHLRYLVEGRFINASGMYLRLFRRCVLNYENTFQHVVGWGVLDDKAQQVLTMRLASTIVHEATHARIDDAGISYDEQHRERIERICNCEQIRFLRRAAGDFCDVTGQAVDWTREYNFEESRDFYDQWWGKSTWQHFCDVMRGVWRECDDGQQPEAERSWRQTHREYWEFTHQQQLWCLSMLYTRGCVHAMANNHVEAVEDYRQIVELDPEHEEARLGWGTQFYYAGNYEKALEVFLVADHSQDGLTDWIVMTLWQLDRRSEALLWLDRKLADEQALQWNVGRALLLAELGRTGEAIRILRRSLDNESIAVGTEQFSWTTTLAQLLLTTGDRRGYLVARQQLASAVDQWRQSSDASPIETVGYVLRTPIDMYRPGVRSCRACLLVCPEEVDSPQLRTDLEHVANDLSAAVQSDSHEYEAVYLRSLLSTHDDYPWREVPETLAGNRQLWVIDVILDRLLLPDARLVDPWVTCSVRKTESSYSACVGDGRIFDPPISAANVCLPMVETEVPVLPAEAGWFGGNADFCPAAQDQSH